jgi:hypothetical protein
MLLYGQTRAAWVDSQLLQARKILARRQEPLRVIVVSEAPPPKNDERPGVKLPGMPYKYMVCNHPDDTPRFDALIATLSGGGS